MRCIACDKLMKDHEVQSDTEPMCLGCRGESFRVWTYTSDHEYDHQHLTNGRNNDNVDGGYETEEY